MTEFDPIIKKKKSTLHNKKVSIEGNNDFSRFESDKNSFESNQKPIKATPENNSTDNNNKLDHRLKASKTQKVSPSTNLKITTLKPFLKETESMSSATFNEIIDMLVDNYVQTKLTTRQNEAYKSMFNNQFDML